MSFIIPKDSDINEIAEQILKNNLIHGFRRYTKPTRWQKILDRFFLRDFETKIVKRNFGEEIALIMSELGEALDSHRKGEALVWWHTSDADGVRKPDGVAIELADAIIRLLDTLLVCLEDHPMTVFDVVNLKMQFNATRPYLHDKEY